MISALRTKYQVPITNKYQHQLTKTSISNNTNYQQYQGLTLSITNSTNWQDIPRTNYCQVPTEQISAVNLLKVKAEIRFGKEGNSQMIYVLRISASKYQ